MTNTEFIMKAHKCAAIFQILMIDFGLTKKSQIVICN